MNGYSILAELLYRISTYEKGRVPVKKIWTKKYIVSLLEAISVMDCIVELMEQNEEKQHEKYQQVLDYLNQNIGVVFQNDVYVKAEQAYRTGEVFFNADMYGVAEQELLQLMKDILVECNMLLTRKEKGYKKRIWYLLMALHNIPRAFFDKGESTYFEMGKLLIGCDDAMKWARSYMGNAEGKER